MPALAKSPVRIPRFKPHARAGGDAGPDAGAGAFFSRNPAFTTAVTPVAAPSRSGEGLDHPALDRLALDRLAHDARNVLAGLRLYCDLLAAPGVLTLEHRHYAPELQGITGAATGILEKILARASASAETISSIPAPHALPERVPAPLAPAPVADAAAELRRLGPLLAAIAGPSVRLSVDTMPCPGQTALSVEDLTRVLVNLVRNAADAMPAGGRIRVTAQYGGGFSFFTAIHGAHPNRTTPAPRTVLITVADNGPGIPAALRERVFDAGFTTHGQEERSATERDWPAPRRRGLGLNIVRGLVESAGGAVRVTPKTFCGACFEIVLPILDPATPSEPITSGTYPDPPHSAFPAARPRKGA